MSVIISDARAEDASALGAILSDWIDATDWMPRLHQRQDDAEFVGRLIARGQVRVARKVGAVGVIARDGAEIDALYVAPRGQGMGRALIAEAQAQQPHLALWTFAANAPARAFYAAMGFAETGGTQGDNAENLPDIRMEWHR